MSAQHLGCILAAGHIRAWRPVDPSGTSERFACAYHGSNPCIYASTSVIQGERMTLQDKCYLIHAMVEPSAENRIFKDS